MREKLVLIGAGSAMFTRGLVADVLRRGWECELGLVDTDAEALAVAEGLCRKMSEARKAPVRLLANTDRRQVLRDATVVITTVGVGGRRGWEQDVFIPRKYGIFQPVGDSVMPGGTSRALRMIPPMVAIAEDVLELAPRALFFNYGNPMTAVCRAVRKETGAGIVGLCHGVFHVGQQIAEWLRVAAQDLRYTAIGLNHLTWFVELRAKGDDLMPRMLARAEQVLGKEFRAERLATGTVEAGSAAPEDSLLDRAQPFCLHLLRIFGAYPAVGDRHVSEFFPHLFPEGKHFGRTLGVDRFSLEAVIASGDRIYADMKERAFSKKPLGEEFFAQMSGEHEQVIEIVESIRRDLGRVYSANLPNRGQVPNLPAEAMLESPAVATGSGMKAITQRPLPSGIVGALATRLAWVETVVEAALEGSRQKFVQALMLDGSVTSIEMAERLADDLLAAHAEHLPRFSASAPGGGY